MAILLSVTRTGDWVVIVLMARVKEYDILTHGHQQALQLIVNAIPQVLDAIVEMQLLRIPPESLLSSLKNCGVIVGC